MAAQKDGGAAGAEAALVPSALPPWFYPLRWHATFRAADRVATLEKTLEKTQDYVRARIAERSAAGDYAPDPGAASALAHVLELAHFASCATTAEYADMRPLLARLSNDETTVRDAWWEEVALAKGRLCGEGLLGSLLRLTPPPLEVCETALMRRDGRGAVRFGACTGAAASYSLFGVTADRLEIKMQTLELPVLRRCSAAELLRALFADHRFEGDAWLWVEDANAADAPLRYATARAVLCGLEPLPGLSEAAPACVDDRLPLELRAHARVAFYAFCHVANAAHALGVTILHAADSQLVVPPPPGYGSYMRRLGSWVLYKLMDDSDFQLKEQLLTALHTEGYPLCEWLCTRDAGRLDSEASREALRIGCRLSILRFMCTDSAVPLARALCGAVRWLDAAGDYADSLALTWQSVCCALHSALKSFPGEHAPHTMATHACTVAAAHALAMPRWTPPAAIAGSEQRSDAEADGDTTAWCALLRAARGIAAAANEGAVEEDTARDALQAVGRVVRSSVATLTPQGLGLGVLMWHKELGTQWPESAAMRMLMDATSKRDERSAGWALTYWLLPAAYLLPASRRALRGGAESEPLRHCRCARCVPTRADGGSFDFDQGSAVYGDSALVGQHALTLVAAAARAAVAFPSCSAIAARAVAYAMQGCQLPTGDAELAARHAEVIRDLQCARVLTSTWPAGAAGMRRCDAAIATIMNATNRRTALAGLRLSPPIRDDSDEADIIIAADPPKASADADGDGCCMSDDEVDSGGNINLTLACLLLDRALCALTGDGSADGRLPPAAAAEAAEAAAAALLAEEEAAKGAAPSRPVDTSSSGKKKRPGSSARKRAAAAAAAAVPAPAVETRTKSGTAAADAGSIPAAAPAAQQPASLDSVAVATMPSVPEPPAAASGDASLDELFPWLALGGSTTSASVADDVAHEDDALCIVCLDAERDTALPGCATAHAPVLCAACAVSVAHAARAVCPWCDAPCAGVD